MDYMALSAAERQQEYDKVSAEYESWKAKGLKLNMARGKPSKQQLDLVSGILTALTSAEECVDSGVDARNYGELKGLESARKLFADILIVLFRFAQIFKHLVFPFRFFRDNTFNTFFKLYTRKEHFSAAGEAFDLDVASDV